MVVASRAVKGLRTRYGLAGNKADQSDAYILADCLRTDGHRWASLQPDTPQTVALRASVRGRKDLVAMRVATANQLRAHLGLVFPAAVGLFAEIDGLITLRFLERFPSADKATWLSERRLHAWLQANGYSGRRTASELLDRLRTAPQGVQGATVEAQAVVTLSQVRILRVLVAEIAQFETHIREQLALHPDGPLFCSLPRAGTVRAAARLVEIGDCRARFPSPEALAALAGAVPSTRASGQHRMVTLRWTCDKSCATPWSTLRRTPCARARGRTSCTDATAKRTKPIRMPGASSRVPGSASSGAAGKTISPTTLQVTGHSSASSHLGGLT